MPNDKEEIIKNYKKELCARNYVVLQCCGAAVMRLEEKKAIKEELRMKS